MIISNVTFLEPMFAGGALNLFCFETLNLLPELITAFKVFPNFQTRLEPLSAIYVINRSLFLVAKNLQATPSG